MSCLAAVNSAIHSLVLVLWALQMCMVLCHWVECDAANFTGVASLQTWNQTEYRTLQERIWEMNTCFAQAKFSKHDSVIQFLLYCNWPIRINPSQWDSMSAWKRFLYADGSQSSSRWAFLWLVTNKLVFTKEDSHNCTEGEDCLCSSCSSKIFIENP